MGKKKKGTVIYIFKSVIEKSEKGVLKPAPAIFKNECRW